LANAVEYKSDILKTELEKIAADFPEFEPKVRGLGMIYALELPSGVANEVSAEAFERGLVIETAGADDQVLKFLPSLLIDENLLHEGIGIIRDSLKVLSERRNKMMTGQ
jgi:diaminobutyrate-2-oxoglutarate transaminase